MIDTELALCFGKGQCAESSHLKISALTDNIFTFFIGTVSSKMPQTPSWLETKEMSSSMLQMHPSQRINSLELDDSSELIKQNYQQSNFISMLSFDTF